MVDKKFLNWYLISHQILTTNYLETNLETNYLETNLETNNFFSL